MEFSHDDQLGLSFLRSCRGCLKAHTNGTSSLAAEGLYPVKFGGLSRYFAILACYMLGFMAVAFAVVRRTCKQYDRQ